MQFFESCLKLVKQKYSRLALLIIVRSLESYSSMPESSIMWLRSKTYTPILGGKHFTERTVTDT